MGIIIVVSDMLMFDDILFLMEPFEICELGLKDATMMGM